MLKNNQNFEKVDLRFSLFDWKDVLNFAIGQAVKREERKAIIDQFISMQGLIAELNRREIHFENISKVVFVPP